MIKKILIGDIKWQSKISTRKKKLWKVADNLKRNMTRIQTYCFNLIFLNYILPNFDS